MTGDTSRWWSIVCSSTSSLPSLHTSFTYCCLDFILLIRSFIHLFTPSSTHSFARKNLFSDLATSYSRLSTLHLPCRTWLQPHFITHYSLEFISLLLAWRRFFQPLGLSVMHIFLAVTVSGTLGILINAPHIFDYIDQEEIRHRLINSQDGIIWIPRSRAAAGWLGIRS